MGEINHLAQLFHTCNKELLEYETKPLVGPGENYGSVMLSIEATVAIPSKDKGDNKEKKQLSLVAKLCPPNAWLQEMFDTANTFRKEVWFYSTVLPLLQNFQALNGVSKPIDFFPIYVASRLNLANMNDDIVDEDAALVLVNAKTMGYKLEDRMIGFDEDTTTLILRNMAEFHAVAIAFKLKYPKLFQEQIRRHLNGHPAFSALPDSLVKELMDQTVELVRQDERCAGLAERFQTAYDRSAKIFIAKKMEAREPFATITHNDFWVNNTMVRWKRDEPIHNVMLDWQMIDYGNPCNDLVFFLLTSVRYDTLPQFDKLVRMYYDELIGTLRQFRCDITPFSYDAFCKCIDEAVMDSQIFHITAMFKPILKRKHVAGNMEMAVLTTDVFLSMDGLDNVYMEKLWHTVEFLAARNWI